MRITILVLGAMLLGPLQSSGDASGTYVLRPPQPSLVDAEQYETGKAVFQGKLHATGTGAQPQVSHLPRLQELQSRLPVKVKRSTDLVRLAGSLSAGQLSALEYYLKVRFKVQ